MALIDFGGTKEEVIMRNEFPMDKALKVLKNETIAVIGYGVQGPGQSLNLKDNGFKVIIGQSKQFKEDWEQMDCMNFLFISKGMTKEILEKYFIKFYKAHFLRIKTLWGYFTMLWRSPDSWLRFISNLKGFITFARSDKRMGRIDAQE